MSEYVLIQTGTNPRNGSKIYHEPDPENPTEPACVRFPTDDEWLRKDPELLPNHRMCKDCSGESKRGTGGRSDLHLRLEQMDPEDVGGETA